MITEEMIMSMTDEEVAHLDESIPLENKRTLQIIIQKCLSYLESKGNVTSGVMKDGDIGWMLNFDNKTKTDLCSSCTYLNKEKIPEDYCYMFKNKPKDCRCYKGKITQ